ncbi:MAG: haloacid dehalogenase-like hydrolase, partial [Xanthobacteraceae bacterium]
PYTDLTYQPMQDVLSYFRANGYKTYIVTGGGQDFVRQYSERVYGIPPEQVVGSAGDTTYGYDKDGKPILTKDPKLLLNNDNAGKPEGIHLQIGRRPHAAFGNSSGDRQMLEYTGAGDGVRLMMLVLHDDAQREYAYGPAQDLPDTKVGTFPPALYDEAKKNGWTVISMKNDWKRIFAFE